jgi:hypothetical protein
MYSRRSMLHGCGEKKVMAMDLIERRASLS